MLAGNFVTSFIDFEDVKSRDVSLAAQFIVWKPQTLSIFSMPGFKLRTLARVRRSIDANRRTQVIRSPPISPSPLRPPPLPRTCINQARFAMESSHPPPNSPSRTISKSWPMRRRTPGSSQARDERITSHTRWVACLSTPTLPRPTPRPFRPLSTPVT